jgi:Ca2+:H+ antiporter
VSSPAQRFDLRRFLLSGSGWPYLMVPFIPVAIALELAHASASLVFVTSALGVIPTAALMGRATEELAARSGPGIGGFLNVTFGNAPELIIALVALHAGQLEMVRASIIGAILANLLLALGIAFLLGGLKYHDQTYNRVAARTYATMMLLAAMSLAIPSAFSRVLAPDETVRQEAMLNVGVAAALLAIYVLYLIYSLRTHRGSFASESGESGHGHGDDAARWSLPRALGSLVVASLLAAWMSEVLVGAADGTGKALGMSSVFIGIVFLAVVGGAAESGSAIAMGAKNKPDLSISIALGSSIQIALFIAPVLVFASYFIAPAPLELSFSRAEVGTLFIGVIIGAMVYGDGQANWFKGVQLITIYLIIAMMFYFMPGVSQ